VPYGKIYLQIKGKGIENKDGKRTQRIAMPKLIYVHEGYDLGKSSKKRKALKDLHCFGGIYKDTEDLWIEVLDYIYAKYNVGNGSAML
jgi:hypothetical protein